MDNINFHEVLRKNISETSFIEIANNNLDENTYIIPKPKIEFFGKKIDDIIISTNDLKKIERVHIILSGSLDSTIYKKISFKYGDDFDVMIREIVKIKKKESKKRIDEQFEETISKKRFLLKKGSIIDSNINHLIWNKEKYAIMLYYNHFSNKSEVHFINK